MDGNRTQDHSEAILRFARENEQALKQKAVEALSAYFARSTAEDYIPKFLRGRKEHGPLDTRQDWDAELLEEFQDCFWYTAIQEWFLGTHSDPLGPARPVSGQGGVSGGAGSAE